MKSFGSDGIDATVTREDALKQAAETHTIVRVDRIGGEPYNVCGGCGGQPVRVADWDAHLERIADRLQGLGPDLAPGDFAATRGWVMAEKGGRESEWRTSCAQVSSVDGDRVVLVPGRVGDGGGWSALRDYRIVGRADLEKVPPPTGG